ncbi:MAG: hypothetical protein EAZ24_08710 [Burkholderiales bacterium]|nr:MAG: hypothetical protein EAZ24_08710 [Burkholderiales bacterium]TAG82626.1 MAG: hypothetical protein EAZ21_03260 [Betaproteobacteria bacterium]
MASCVVVGDGFLPTDKLRYSKALPALLTQITLIAQISADWLSLRFNVFGRAVRLGSCLAKAICR